LVLIGVITLEKQEEYRLIEDIFSLLKPHDH
jgi:hypothetical protein